jgi:hypothetical protein
MKKNSNKNLSGVNDSNNYKGEITTDENKKFRPISAVNKRPDFMLKKQKSLHMNKQSDFPNVHYSSNNYLQNHNIFCDMLKKTNKSITGISKERLYEELLQYKNSLNTLRKELSLLKGDNLKKDQEIIKKDKILEDIVHEVDSNPLNSGKSHKAKDAYFIASLKTQFKEMKHELEQKTEEYQNLKKNIKNTKFKELQIEVTTLSEELNKLKNFYSISLQQNLTSENIVNDINMLREENLQQAKLIDNKTEIISRLENDCHIRDNDLQKIKEDMDRTITKSKMLSKQLVNQKEINNRVMKNNNDDALISNLKMSYENKLESLNSEFNKHVKSSK